MKKELIFKEGERKCYDCGEDFIPREKDLEEAKTGDDVYCRCPNPDHARYTMAVVAE